MNITTIAPVNMNRRAVLLLGQPRQQPAERPRHPVRVEARVGGRREQARPVRRDQHDEQAQRRRSPPSEPPPGAGRRRGRASAPARARRRRAPRARRGRSAAKAVRRPACCARESFSPAGECGAGTMQTRRYESSAGATNARRSQMQRARRRRALAGRFRGSRPRSAGRSRPSGPSRPAPGRRTPSRPPAASGNPRR